MKLLDYIIYRANNYYQHEGPDKILTLLSISTFSLFLMAVNSLEMLTAQELINLNADGARIIVLTVFLIPMAYHRVYFASGRFKELSFVETKLDRIVKGIALFLLWMIICLGAALVFVLRNKFFEDISKH